MSVEIWKVVDCYPNYQISNLGNIKSMNYHRGKRERILIPQEDKCGYLIVRLYNENGAKPLKIHRLVAQSFIPNPDNKPQVNHINGNKQDNRAENLEWCNNSENQIHAWGTGLQKKYIGKENPKSKKVKQFDINNKYIKTWDCIREVERTLKIKNCNITSCCKGKKKTAGGYIWKYAEVEQ